MSQTKVKNSKEPGHSIISYTICYVQIVWSESSQGTLLVAKD